MKKTRVLAAALIATTLLAGAGYAAWTSDVNIKHNIATGNMNVEFQIPANYSSIAVSGSKYVKPTVDANAKLTTFTLENLYPGATYTTLTEEKNTGTIGVKYDKAVVTFPEDNENLKKNMTVSFNCWVFDKNGKHIDSIHLPAQSNVKLADLDKALDIALKDVTLEPGQVVRVAGHSVDQLMEFKLNDGENMDNATQNNTFSFNIQLNWKQFNK